MTNSIETLLVRNPYEVFGERDYHLRRAVIGELFDPDCVFSDPNARYVGQAELNEAVEKVQAGLPDHRFSQIGEVDLLKNGGRLAWGFGPPEDPHRITGLDVIVVNGDRIAAL